MLCPACQHPNPEKAAYCGRCGAYLENEQAPPVDFEKLLGLDSRGMQTVLKETTMEDLVLAMKPASPQLKDLIYGSMSQRAAEMLREDLDILGPVLESDVQDAQRSMYKVALRLSEEKMLIFPSGNKTV